MQCPKCLEGEMTLVSDGSTNVNQCNNCHGLYFEQLNQAKLDEVASHVHLDTGDEARGAEFDDMVYIECPKCDQIMDHRSITDPVTIRFEICIACHSTFLDAGEFRQYLSEGYIGEFRALLPVD